MPKDMRTVKAIITMCHPRQDLRPCGHLLSLERNQHYTNGETACQAKDIGFFYSCLLAFIFTPGPMVEAATQDLIYWPLAAAGLALMMAPSRAE